ncbi:MAG: [ribosomal protein S5]-alanine N-acetyltransferase [Methanolobus sp.]|jgi:RimJ/RimL family protein N-acetyltransferase|uniref:GNAT family N-acetyltransferase n=1 Tax=Methanolobus sp. TaxID=1874737 RepID=UPI0024AC451F|nr:GNAT family protein [Methanolobus sp.]MDI3485221.1 [ribosomal protein S5]-alanine N-acetyltransferase [Methanolobus sp.]MDK2831693.1 [ribosomal protein S5]-alanine N-acetyltransferase [Methanolobus sp.]MDK2938994.1 [ribosomal protein S5]-alanine N-acetyltransferase [Methanolobus sp.]
MRIVTDDFTLREWEERDAEKLTSIANNRKIANNLRDGFPHPYSIKDAKQYISSVRLEDTDSKQVAIEIEGRVAGSMGAFFKENIHRKNVEIGYFLAEEYWGKGIMPKAVRCMTQYLFENYDIIRVYAQPFFRNTASRRVLEKAGFRCEAILKNNIIKNDVVQDSCIYAVLKDEF